MLKTTKKKNKGNIKCFVDTIFEWWQVFRIQDEEHPALSGTICINLHGISR